MKINLIAGKHCMHACKTNVTAQCTVTMKKVSIHCDFYAARLNVPMLMMQTEKKLKIQPQHRLLLSTFFYDHTCKQINGNPTTGEGFPFNSIRIRSKLNHD